MKGRKSLLVLMTLVLVLSFTGCSGKKDAGASPVNNAAGNPVKETAEANKSQVYNAQYYKGEMGLEDISVATQKLAEDFQTGKVKMDEYIQRLEELQQKAMESIGAETPSAGSSSGTVSDNTHSAGDRVVDAKYRGQFIIKQAVGENGLIVGNIIEFEKVNIITGSWAEMPGFKENINWNSESPWAYTVGNELMIAEESDMSYRKMGTFTDVNTFVNEAGITYKRQ